MNWFPNTCKNQTGMVFPLCLCQGHPTLEPTKTITTQCYAMAVLATGADFLVNFDGAKTIAQQQTIVSSFSLVRKMESLFIPGVTLKAHNTISISIHDFVQMGTKPKRNHD